MSKIARLLSILALLLPALLLAVWLIPAVSSKPAALSSGRSQREAALGDAIRAIGEKDPDASPHSQIRSLFPIQTASGAHFGYSVAVDGDTAVVGANDDLDLVHPPDRDGAAYVFTFDGVNWNQQQRLWENVTFSGYGTSVAIDGDTIAVSEIGASGSVYVYTRTAGVWTQQARLLPSGGVNTSGFGRSISLSGDTIIATATDYTTPELTAYPSVYFFQRTGPTWTQVQRVENIGSSVAVDGDYALISQAQDSSVAQSQGSVRVYKKLNGSWTHLQTLRPSDSPANSEFGYSVAISGGDAIVGAPFRPVPANPGAAYIYRLDNGTWFEETVLIPPDGGSRDWFGHSVSISGDRVLIGAPGEIFEQPPGAAYFVHRCGDKWDFIEKYVAPDGFSYDQFGYSVSISGDKGIMGVPTDDYAGFNDPGTAYTVVIEDSPFRGVSCQINIVVNVNTDEPDDNLSDDICDTDISTLARECSLRAAIQTANEKDGEDTITFNIPGVGTHTITPGDTLPLIDEKLTINGASQPGYDGTPVIALQGGVSGANPGLGLLASSGNSRIKGLAIYGFETGISIQSSGSFIESNYLGLKADGTVPTSGQQAFGVVLSNGAANTTIGGTEIADGNVVGGLSVGIGIFGGSGSSRILNNKIGTNAAGDAARPNETGVLINGSNGTRVGEAGDGNLISGNTFAGVYIYQSSSSLVRGNRIGTDAAGNGIIDNLHGIAIQGGGNNKIGDLASADSNLISGNSRFGVVLYDGTANNQVINNSVGTAANGTGVLGNYLTGIAIEGGANSNVIENNVIGGHNETKISTGIYFTPSAGAGNIAKSNFIGVARDGTTAIPNGLGIETASDGQIIGVQGSPNRFCNNTVGVNIRTGSSDPSTSGNLVQYNLFGTNGTELIGKQSIAVAIGGDSSENTIKFNVIGGSETGVALIDGPHDNVISDNQIGNNGVARLQNTFGVSIEFAENNKIKNNILSGNEIGVIIGGAQDLRKGKHSPAKELIRREPGVGAPPYATGNSLSGNVIGLNTAQSAPISNYVGVWIGEEARGNLVGTVAGDRNVIAGNESDAVFIGTLATNPSESIRPRDNLVQRNLIGVDATKAVPFPNGTAVTLAQTSGNTIGGATENLGNTIVASTSDGIRVTDADDNTIINNLIGTIEEPGRGDGLTGTDGPEFGNGGSGIKILGKSIKNKIFKNVIGHSGINGIEVDCPTAPASTEPQTLIAGNHIGVVLNHLGTAARDIRNLAAGILIKNTANVQIGDIGADAGNVIGNNLQHGIHVTGSPTVPVPPIFVDGGTPFATRVVNNALGMIKNANGENIPAGNGFNGLLGENTAGLLVGGDTQALANKVMANARAGLLFKNVQPSGIQTIAARAKANLIGALIENGQLTTNLGNNGGVEIENSNTVEIGTQNQNEPRNLIASNLLHGVKSLTSRLVKVAGNNVLKNAGHALHLRQTDESSVIGNGIGIDVGALIANGGNTGDGIVVEDSEDVTIGDANAGNVVAGNQGDGIKLIQARLTKLQANLVGLYEQKSEYHRLGNKNGVVMIDSENCEIGGLDDLRSNIIAANTEYAILADELSRILKVQNNLAGTVIRNIGNRMVDEPTDAGTNFGNGLGGIKISGGSNSNVIGGPEPNARNFIANNGGPGVWINPTAGTGNWVHQNAIYSNSGRGIELGVIGNNPNDPTDEDLGPNKLQNYPEIVNLALNGQGELLVTYKVDSAPEHSTYGTEGLYVEFFEADPTGAGRTLLGADHYLLTDYNNGTPGTRVKNLGTPASIGLEAEDEMTVSVTDNLGNTSEFAPAVEVPPGTGTPTPTATPTASPSGTPTATPTNTPTATPTASPTPQSTPFTPPGNNVTTTNPAGNGSVTFSGVTTGGITSFTPIDPNSQGAPPSGFVLLGGDTSYDISTTAVVVPPIVVCFNFALINDPNQFALVRILHGEGGQLIDRTILAPDTPAPNFATRTVCSRVNSLSPFIGALAPGGTPTATPTASPTPAGFEGDVTPRAAPDGVVLTTDVTQIRRFVTGLDTLNASVNEGQRADCAPRTTFGDGAITSSDVVQARRYVTGLDPLTPAAGPQVTAPALAESFLSWFDDAFAFLYGRQIGIGVVRSDDGGRIAIPVEMTTYGDEAGVSFTLEYDASDLSDPQVSLGDAAPADSVLTVNTNETGRIGILVDSAEPMIVSTTSKAIVLVTFNVSPTAIGAPKVALSGSLAPLSISDRDGNLLKFRYLDGNAILPDK